MRLALERNSGDGGEVEWEADRCTDQQTCWQNYIDTETNDCNVCVSRQSDQFKQFFF